MSNDDTILKIGSILNGKYIVEKYLGGGAFGEVYRVKHQYLKNRRAIKVFKNAPDIKGNPSSIQQLLEEAILLTKFDHENIVKVHDAGILKADNGEEHVFFEMDFYSKDLDEYWKSYGARFVPIDVVIRIIKQICMGLNVLHSEKPPMIHRDIKPQNIMVDFDNDGQPIAKLTDFGLVKTVNPSTLYASAKGTLAFKAPEFLEKKDDTSTDIFAVGVTFYMLLTDKLPYPIDSEFDVMTGAWLKTTPKPLNEYNPLAYDKGLEKIVFTAISTDPEKRYRDAKELLDAITAWENSDELDVPEGISEIDSSVKVTPSGDSQSKPVEDTGPKETEKPEVSAHDDSLRSTHIGESKKAEDSTPDESLRSTHIGGSKKVEDSVTDESLRSTRIGGSDKPDDSLRSTPIGGSKNAEDSAPDESLRSTYIGDSKKPKSSDDEEPKQSAVDSNPHIGGSDSLSDVFESDLLENLFDAGDEMEEVSPERNPEDLIRDALWAVSNSMDYQRGIDYLKQAFSQVPELKSEYGSKLDLWQAFVLMQNPNTVDEGINNLKNLANRNTMINNEYSFAFDLLSRKDAKQLEKEAVFCSAYKKFKEASALIELAMLMDVTIRNRYKNKLKKWKNGME